MKRSRPAQRICKSSLPRRAEADRVLLTLITPEGAVAARIPIAASSTVRSRPAQFLTFAEHPVQELPARSGTAATGRPRPQAAPVSRSTSRTLAADLVADLILPGQAAPPELVGRPIPQAARPPPRLTMAGSQPDQAAEPAGPEDRPARRLQEIHQAAEARVASTRKATGNRAQTVKSNSSGHELTPKIHRDICKTTFQSERLDDQFQWRSQHQRH